MSAIQFEERLLMPQHRICKRFLDIVLTLFSCVIFSPVLIAVPILVKLTSRGKVFYGHKRIGLGGKHFKAWKFRTMVDNADQVLQKYLDANPELREEWEKDQKLRKDPRVTAVGRFLRLTSLDELPQLWNVLCGEMSLVGPRPIVDNEVVKYADDFLLYVRVRPGLTGLWQVSGRNNTTYDERVAYDRFYVHNWSPWFDAYILLRTIKVVLLREGAF